MRLSTVLTISLFAFVSAATADGGNWPRFRGPGGNGIAGDAKALPAKFGPGENILWKLPLAKGHSSPVVHGDRVFLTAFRARKLVTIAVDAVNGKVVWERETPYKKLERFHRIGSPATPSVATNGKLVVSFFGSAGMTAFSRDGKQLWRKAMGPFNNQFGATSSPVLVGDRIVTVQSHDTGSYLAAIDANTGNELWKVERPNVRRNYGSPTIWQVEGKPQVVVAGTAHAMGYDLASGKPVWTIRGLCRVVSNTPVVGDDGRLYIASSGGGSTPPQPSFAELLKKSDANANGRLESGELPKSGIKRFFGQFDRNADGSLDKAEYESIREIYRLSRTVAMAVKPGGRGDITKTHVAWEAGRGIPRNASPLHYKGHLYLVKDGGVMSVLDAKTGRNVKQKRLAGRGKYYSSPVCGDGKIYLLDDRGTLTVLSADPSLKQLHMARFNEAVLATPAIADGRVYVRTVGTLYCFGAKP